MTVLLLAGLGPYFRSADDLVGSFFDPAAVPALRDAYRDAAGVALDLGDLVFTASDGSDRALLRYERSGSLSVALEELDDSERPEIPNLVAFTLQSILANAGIAHEYLPLSAVWDGTPEPRSQHVDAVLISTTFVVERFAMARAVEWAHERYPGAHIIVGGQYSNLKYTQILLRHPEVTCIVRGDAEDSLPRLLHALAHGGDLRGIPNLVMRDGAGGIVDTGIDYIDLDAYPSPSFAGRIPIVPYESMRGCPFSCKFCSFPAASPKWRYKSARKIVDDWRRYQERNGAVHIRALDSTFTVPPTRFRELLRLLPGTGVGWEAFTRANSIKTADTVEALAAAGCRALSIGFESMSPNSLEYMKKEVTAAANRRAFELLRGGPVHFRISFMVGYPGETPEDYRRTHDFLVQDFEGHFQLYVFSLQDETMPVWQDAERFGLRVVDEDNPDFGWAHRGMDVQTARRLRQETLQEVRRRNDGAVALLWQPYYQTPLVPEAPAARNYRIEKLLERLGMLPLDEPSPTAAAPVLRSLLAELRECGVRLREDAGVAASR